MNIRLLFEVITMIIYFCFTFYIACRVSELRRDNSRQKELNKKLIEEIVKIKEKNVKEKGDE